MKKRAAFVALTTTALFILSLSTASLVSCKKTPDSSSPTQKALFSDPASDDSSRVSSNDPPKKFSLDDRGKDLLERAKAGDEADVIRFSTYVGAAGLIELSRDKDGKDVKDSHETRALALSAMAYSPSLSCVDVLAEAAKDGSDDDAKIALTSLHDIAARPRMQVDLEDFAELAYACDSLSQIAAGKDPERARRATSVLRMLEERGCDAGSLAPPPQMK